MKHLNRKAQKKLWGKPPNATLVVSPHSLDLENETILV